MAVAQQEYVCNGAAITYSDELARAVGALKKLQEVRSTRAQSGRWVFKQLVAWEALKRGRPDLHRIAEAWPVGVATTDSDVDRHKRKALWHIPRGQAHLDSGRRLPPKDVVQRAFVVYVIGLSGSGRRRRDTSNPLGPWIAQEQREQERKRGLREWERKRGPRERDRLERLDAGGQRADDRRAADIQAAREAAVAAEGAAHPSRDAL